MARNLTEKQQKFLDVLFEEAGGNLVKAKKLAGYADAVTSRQVAEPLADEIADLTKKFIASSSTKAAYSMFEIMNNPTDLGNKEKMAAAKDVCMILTPFQQQIVVIFCRCMHDNDTAPATNRGYFLAGVCMIPT